MIHMSMGGDDTNKVIHLVDNKLRIRHLYFVALRCVFESHAAVDHDPPAIVAKQIQVHADLAATAEGDKPKIFDAGCHRVIRQCAINTPDAGSVQP